MSDVFKLLSNVNLELSFYKQRQIDIEMIKENLMNMQDENWLHYFSIKPKVKIYKLFERKVTCRKLYFV